MPRGGKRPGAGRPKGSTRERKAGKQLVTQASLPEGNPILDALNALGGEFGAKEFLQAIYRSKAVPLDARFTAAAKVMPFEVAKPRANAQASAGGITFTFKRHVPT